jgi:REP element-mobilizing transposase RayT
MSTPSCGVVSTVELLEKALLLTANMSRAREPQLDLKFRTWGGRRRGAGRKPGPGGPGVPHRTRPALAARFPVHVTYRLVRGLPSARRPTLFREMRTAFAAGRARFGGRLCHFNVQGNHLHLVVEANDRDSLRRAMQGLAIRLARAINRVLGRTGKVFADRYHMRILRTPAEVRNALHYVVENCWEHRPVRPDFFVEQDYCSSLAWRDRLVVKPRTWLLRSAERTLGLAVDSS